MLEIDERSSKRIYPYVKPDLLVITNLFRDSPMRNAHPQYIADFIESAVSKTTKLILNADDLISSGICPDNPRVYFALDRLPTDVTVCINLINDVQICPVCRGELVLRLPPVSPHRQGPLRRLRLQVAGERLLRHRN